jgi:hypothetical protein
MVIVEAYAVALSHGLTFLSRTGMYMPSGVIITHRSKMNLYFHTIIVVMLMCTMRVDAQRVAIDPVIAEQAQAAVQKMGLELMRGNFKYSQERMYPRWKRRLAKRIGSMESLDRQLASGDQQRVKMGLIVSGYRADRPTAFFDVWRANKVNPDSGKLELDDDGREIMVSHWLAVVPTTTQVKVPDPQQGGRMRTLEEKSYAIAITEKGANNWYFLTGMKPTIQDLRSLFPSLPIDRNELGLPESSAREIK